MQWFTTKEAAEKLQVTQGRVRQLISKHRNSSALVAQKDGRNIVSQTFIDNHLESVRGYAKKGVSPSVNSGDAPSDDSLLNDLAEGLHIASNGNHIQVFSSDSYSAFREQLLDARHLAVRLKEEQDRRNYIEKQLDQNRVLLDKTLVLIEQSLSNIEEKLQERKRDQYIEYEKLKGDN